MAGPSLMDSLFQRSVDDVIKGIRLSPPGVDSAFISRSLDEIRREIKSTDPETKAVALHKLTYLHSLHGADMSWAAFHAVELSSAAAHHQKSVAFLAASLSFDPSTTQVILLLTHQLRKDLSSSNVHDISLALSTLSSLCNPDLARDLTPEVFTLLGSTKPFVRKKALATVLRVFEQYPDAVRVCFKRVVENLENADMGILSAVVGLFCELAEKEPRSYLPLAPEFYRILVDCRNNWVLIKVLKIFAKLVPLEPRLGKRVVEPICEHMRKTGAKSLAFECVRTIVTSLSEYDSAVKLAVVKVQEFLLEDDPNLKYLGLHALAIISCSNLWAVLENKDFVVKALSDDDENIRLEALRLVMCMVSEDNVMDICRILISQALKSDPKFCNEILGFILLTCSRNLYEVVYDFDWYVSFLGEMARVPHCEKGSDIESQLVDIGMRVKDARFHLVHIARDLVIDPALLGNPFMHGVLAAAAWISGEYVELSRTPFEIIEALLQPRTDLLAPSVRAVYIQSVFKVFVFCLNSHLKLDGDDAASSFPPMTAYSDFKDDNERDFRTVSNMVVANGQNLSSSRTHHLTLESLLVLMDMIETNLGPLVACNEVELHERASNVLGLVKLVKPKLLDTSEVDTVGEELKYTEVVKLIFGAFSEDLGPVSASAQERVPVPDGLILKENLCDLDDICVETQFTLPTSFSLVKHPMEVTKEEFEPSTESTSLLAEHKKRHGLYYLPSESPVIISNDHLPAHERKDNKAIEPAEDLVKLTEQSLVVNNKRRNQAKPRPVVVRLDDGEGFHVAERTTEFKPDLISGAVQEVLLGNEATTSTSSTRRKKPSHRSSKIREFDESNTGVSESSNDKEKAADVSEIEVTGSRRRTRHARGKERKHRNCGKDKEDKHDEHRSRRRGDGALAAQSPVIPDFLL